MTDRKTQRKNKTNLVIKWPSHDDYFVISPGDDGSMASKALMTLNPEFVEITLRVRLKKAIEEDKLVVEIGSKNTGKGRPIKAFAMTPVSQLVREKAKHDGIIPPDSKSTPIIKVSSNPIMTESIPVTNIINQPVLT